MLDFCPNLGQQTFKKTPLKDQDEGRCARNYEKSHIFETHFLSEFPRLNYGYESRAKLASFDPLTTSVVTFLNASVIFLPLLLG